MICFLRLHFTSYFPDDLQLPCLTKALIRPWAFRIRPLKSLMEIRELFNMITKFTPVHFIDSNLPYFPIKQYSFYRYCYVRTNQISHSCPSLELSLQGDLHGKRVWRTDVLSKKNLIHLKFLPAYTCFRLNNRRNYFVTWILWIKQPTATLLHDFTVIKQRVNVY